MQALSFSHQADTQNLDASQPIVLFFTSDHTLLAPSFDLSDAQQPSYQDVLTAALFYGEYGNICTLPGSAFNLPFSSVICVGVGKSPALSHDKAMTLGAKVARYHTSRKLTHGQLISPVHSKLSSVDQLQLCLGILRGFMLASYHFDRFKRKKENPTKSHLEAVTVCHKEAQSWQQAIATVQHAVTGQCFAKDLMHTPPNVLTPDAFAQEITKMAELGLEVTIFDEKKLLQERMHALLAVGQGSSNPPRLAIMRWPGTMPQQKPMILVGKGICYDSGGLNLKMAMQVDMKYDMGGAATVCGTMMAIAKQKISHPVIGIVALAENMPDGNAYRPSDIIESRAGLSINILNTDAEGRLALADALDYAVTTYQPRAVIDLATLTGAMVVSLGHAYAGVFTNDSNLFDHLSHAAQMVSEKIWRMPLDPVYDEAINSPVADIQNLGSPTAGAGSVMAAQFLQRFVKKAPWAHFDIAGTAWIPAGNDLCDTGPTGWGVATLTQYLNTLSKEH
jgi:leucyl aminopeptidase